MNPKLTGHTLDRSYPKLVLPPNRFEEVHARFSPSHRSPLCALITPRVPDVVIAGGPFEIIEVGHTRVSKTVSAAERPNTTGGLGSARRQGHGSTGSRWGWRDAPGLVEQPTPGPFSCFQEPASDVHVSLSLIVVLFFRASLIVCRSPFAAASLTFIAFILPAKGG